MPKINEIKRGRDIGKNPPSNNFIWAACERCGKLRWVHYSKKTEKPRWNYCGSCGCTLAVRKPKVSFSERRINRLFTSFKVRARRRNLVSNLSKILFVELADSDCYYCGNKPANKENDRGKIYTYQGIDRVDNSKGYEVDNVVPCCIVCNKMKKAMGQEEFLLHILKIASRFEVKSPQSDFNYEPDENVLVL